MKFTNESRRKQLFPNVSDADWNDWHWQVANRAETLEDLKKYIELTPEEEEGVKACLPPQYNPGCWKERLPALILPGRSFQASAPRKP